jgi:hypothetical protein
VKIWKLLSVTAILLAAVLSAGVAPASAAGGVLPCGSFCDWHDPNARDVFRNNPPGFYACSDDAVNVLSPVLGLQLRYSNHCETTWGLYVGDCSCQVDYFLIESYDRNGTHLRANSIDRSNTNSAATVMLDDHRLLNRVCMRYSQDDGATKHDACTGKF